MNKSYFDSTLIGYTAPPTRNDEQKHYVTLCNISKKIYDNYFNPNSNAYSYNGATTITNGLRISKTTYCVRHLDTTSMDGNLRMLVIRPDDTITRPCIMITNGAADELNCRDYIFWKLAADFALRGYVVVFYENVGSKSFIVNTFLKLGYPFYPSLVNGSMFGVPQITQEQKTKKDFYYVFQNSVAAYNYITQINNTYKINANSISAYGVSLGSFATFSLAYSRQGVNFTNSDYYDFGNWDFTGNYNLRLITTNHFTRLCIPTRKSFNINIKAIAIAAFGIGNDMGDFLPNTGGKKIPTLIYYGKNDNLINFNTGFNNGNSFINIGAKTIKEKLSSLLINNNLIINCSGEHSTITNVTTGTIIQGACNADIDVYTSNYIDEKSFRTVYLLNQITDYNKTTCQFIKNSSLPYNHKDNLFIIPKDVYLSNGNANGHFITNPNGSCIDGLSNINPYRKISTVNDESKITDILKCMVYPNPSNIEITIKLINDEVLNSVELYSLQGEIVYKIDELQKETLTIPTAQLPNGIYKLVVNTNKNSHIQSIQIIH